MQRGDPLRFDQNRIKFSAKRGPFTFWTGIHFPLQFLTKCKGGTLYVLNKVHIKLSKMQRGDPMHFDNFIRPSICYKSRTNKGRFLMKVGFLNFNTPDFSILSLFTGTQRFTAGGKFSGFRSANYFFLKRIEARRRRFWGIWGVKNVFFAKEIMHFGGSNPGNFPPAAG